MSVVPTDILEADVYTLTQRIYGLIHPTAGAAVAEFLNRPDRALLPVTNALVFQPGSPDPEAESKQVLAGPFYAVRKEQILYIRSGYFETQDPVEYVVTRIGVFFDDYCVSGTLRLPRGSRLSDHLERAARQKPFQRLYHARVAPSPTGHQSDDPADRKVYSLSEVLSVNLKNASGIAELDEPAPMAAEVEHPERQAETADGRLTTEFSASD